jgi:hypothetical protein
VLAKKEAVAKTVDGLYQKCVEADEKAASAVKDALEDKKDEKDDEEEDEKPKEKKDGAAKDTAALIDETVKAAVASVTDSLKKDIAALVDASVKDALGLGKNADGKDKKPPVEDSAEDFDVSDLVRTAWGSR